MDWFEGPPAYDKVDETLQILAFIGEPGKLKSNPKTKEFFPPDYVFNPFTGKKLIWKNLIY